MSHTRVGTIIRSRQADAMDRTRLFVGQSR
jgi:hypothetical protein